MTLRSTSDLLSIPSLLLFIFLAVLLFRTRKGGETTPLWVLGLGLIAVESVARIIYLADPAPIMRKISHVVALDAYLLAAALFAASTTFMKEMPHSRTFLVVNSVLACSFLTVYGSELSSKLLFVGVALLAVGLAAAEGRWNRRTWKHLLTMVVIWGTCFALSQAGLFRQASYALLFTVYFSAGVLFFAETKRTGRNVVAAAFFIWGVCFLLHPWIPKTNFNENALLSSIWDLQRFAVMVGLLMMSLDEQASFHKYYAMHDPLTGLANRRLLDDRFEQAVARARRTEGHVVLFTLDLDGFKEVNDLHGHAVGDDLLRQLSKRLAGVIRQSDTLARSGGDEFQVVAADIRLPLDESAATSQTVEGLRTKLKDAVEHRPFLLEIGQNLSAIDVGVSIGVAIFPEDGEPQELFRIADRRMYEAKHAVGV